MNSVCVLLCPHGARSSARRALHMCAVPVVFARRGRYAMVGFLTGDAFFLLLDARRHCFSRPLNASLPRARAMPAVYVSRGSTHLVVRLLCCVLPFSCVNLGCQKDFKVADNEVGSCRYHRLNPVFHDGGKHWGCCPTQVNATIRHIAAGFSSARGGCCLQYKYILVVAFGVEQLQVSLS